MEKYKNPLPDWAGVNSLDELTTDKCDLDIPPSSEEKARLELSRKLKLLRKLKEQKARNEKKQKKSRC